MIYFDNIASTKVDPLVVETIILCMESDYGNASSIHKMGVTASMAVEKARMIIAKEINANPDEIYFTSGGTESNNLVFRGVFNRISSTNKHIVISGIEHPSVYEMAKLLESKGYSVTYLSVDNEGLISLKDIDNCITKDTVLVSIMHVNNEIGSIQPIEEIGKICRDRKVLFHTDACQSFTKVPLDVKRQNIDFATLSGHKIYAPKGVGALYIKKGISICPLLVGGGQEKGIRPGTYNTPVIVGFGKAVEIAKEVDVVRMSKLRDYFIKEIFRRIDGTTLNGPRGEQRVCNNINFTFDKVLGKKILFELNKNDIMISTGSACSSNMLTPSRVIKALRRDNKSANGAIRIGLSKWTTQNEIDVLIDNLVNIVEKERENFHE